MSYILEALKKAEKEGQLKKVPTIMSAQEAPIKANKKSSLFKPILAISIMILVLFLSWLILNETQKVDISKPNPEGIKSLVQPDKEAIRKTEQIIQSTNIDSSKENISNRITPVRESDREVINTSVNIHKGDETTSKISINNQADESKSDIKEISDKQRVFDIKELPQEIQERLPRFIMSVHIYYPENSLRLVKINGQTMKEGDELMGGIRLLEITKNGAILNYQNYKFHIAMNDLN